LKPTIAGVLLAVATCSLALGLVIGGMVVLLALRLFFASLFFPKMSRREDLLERSPSLEDGRKFRAAGSPTRKRAGLSAT
jgi:hypothetical protein